MTTACYEIPNSRLETLKAKVSRLARRCVKLGLEPMAILEHRTSLRTKIVSRKDERGFNIPPGQIVYLDCTWCELTGTSPKVSDHTFIAKVEHTNEGNLVSRVASNSEESDLDLTSYRTAKPVCDHCNQNRRRNDTFVLRAPDGTLKQIGRNCLADYLRSDNVETVVAILDLVNEYQASGDDPEGDGEGSGSGGWYATPLTVDYVACTISAIRSFGWVAKSSGKDNTTASAASFLAGRCPDGESRDAWHAGQPTEADKARAIVILEWIKGTTDQSDYMHNLRVACASKLLTKEGLVASVVQAYMREEEKWEQAKTAKLTDPGHYSQVGAKVEIHNAIVTKVRYLEGNYGTTTLLMMKSPEGHTLKWFASGSKDIQVGQSLTIKGTVKSHELYEGIHQTQLTRCNVTLTSEETQAL